MMEKVLIEYLANASWQVLLLAAGGWLLLTVVRPEPLVQHRVWLAVLGVAVLLPLRGTLYGTGHDAGQAGLVVAVMQTGAPSPNAFSGEAFDVIGQPGGLVLGSPRAGAGLSLSWLAFPAHVRRVRLNAAAAHWILALYLAVALFGLFRIVRGWRLARRLVRNSRKLALSDRERAALTDCSRRLGVALPRVRESSEIAGPVVVGIVAPLLLWPEDFAQHSEDEVMAALCHEMAHIRRRDYLVNLLCEAAALPLNWHPAIYGVARCIRRTREMVCDAMAAEAMQSEMAYAKCLVTLAQSMVGRSGLAERARVPGLFSGNVLEERVMRLMQGKTAMSVRAKVARGVVGVTAMVAAITLAGMFHVVPAMAQAAPVQSGVAGQKVKGGVQEGVDDGTQARVQAGVQDGAVAPVVRVRPVAPVVRVSPVVKVAPLAKPEMVSPVVNVTPEMKIAPLVKLAMVSPVVNVTPMVKVVPEVKVLALPNVQVTPVSPEEPKGSATGAKESGQGSGHRMYAVVDGQERELTPEEQRRVEEHLAEAQRKVAVATARLNSPEFKAQMEKSQRDAEEAVRKLNSGEFQKQMADAQKQVAEATARLNSPEFKAQMDKAQRDAEDATRKVQSAEFQKQMADAQKQVAEAMAKLNSPEFKAQMDKAQRDAEEATRKVQSAEFQKQMAEAQKQIADAMAKMKAEQEKSSK